MPFRRQVTRLLLDRRGITAIEYGMIAGLIAVALIAGATVIGHTLQNIFGDVVIPGASSTTHGG